MPDAVLVFQEAKNREQARAAEGRHAQVFRLKTKGQPHALVFEKTLEIGVHALGRMQHGQHLEQAQAED